MDSATSTTIYILHSMHIHDYTMSFDEPNYDLYADLETDGCESHAPISNCILPPSSQWKKEIAASEYMPHRSVFMCNNFDRTYDLLGGSFDITLETESSSPSDKTANLTPFNVSARFFIGLNCIGTTNATIDHNTRHIHARYLNTWLPLYLIGNHKMILLITSDIPVKYTVLATLADYNSRSIVKNVLAINVAAILYNTQICSYKKTEIKERHVRICIRPGLISIKN